MTSLNVRPFACVIFLVVFITSCGSKFSLQKRRYNKGFYFSVVKNHEVKKSETFGAQNIINKPETAIEEHVTTANALEKNDEQKKNFEKIDTPISKPSATDLHIQSNDVNVDEFENQESSKERTGASKSNTVKKRFSFFDTLNNIMILYLLILMAGATLVVIVYFVAVFQYLSFIQIVGIGAMIVLCILVCLRLGRMFRG